ncbi:MAG: alanine--glyoxylate aminotransferase family protein [Candidatus Thermoplasmatota archaeon]|nr:alanine--glyoxylate aminotransferase family protein [Candidatus Thermoplasmatota archaeon]
MFDLQSNTFMLAGPVKMHPRVLNAMASPAINHRSPDFEKVVGDIRGLLQYVFQTKNDTCLFSGSGTAAIEAAVSNTVKRGDKFISISNGKFSERLYEVAKIFCPDGANEFKVEWGKAPDLGLFEDAVRKLKPKAVAVCHNETSTAVTVQAKELSKIAHDHDAFFIMDGVTSIGSINVPVDEWGCDIAFFGSQKCCAGPAGLSAMAVSDRIKPALYKDTSYYLNVLKHTEKMKKNDTPYTPAIPLFLGMREALLITKEEGLEARFKRIEAIANGLRAACDAMGLQLFADRKYASNTVTAINLPAGVDDDKFRKMMKNEHNIMVASAQEPLKGKFFRIGHMGNVLWNEMIPTIAAMEVCMKKLGHKFELGAGVSAAMKFM